MKTKFLKPSDPKLTKVAKKVSQDQLNSTEIKKIALQMIKIISEEQKGHKKGVGLAAPQIGILKRIILVDVKADGKSPLRPRSEARKVGNLQIYINPKIIWKSKRKGEWYEGCYSTGRICGIVSRPTSIKIQAFVLQPERLQAELVEEKHTKYVARIFQHEIDHLDGKLFINHIQNPDHLHRVEKKEFPLYRNKEAWRHWPKKYSLPLA